MSQPVPPKVVRRLLNEANAQVLRTDKLIKKLRTGTLPKGKR